MAIETEFYDLPTNWAAPLINGDESVFEGDEEGLNAFTDFVDEMVRRYGKCWCIDISEESFFSHFHEATKFGIGGSDCYTYTFDVSKAA